MKTRNVVEAAAALILLFALWLSGSLYAANDAASDAQARNDYILHCSGCHLQDGTGNPSKGIPRFTDQIGYFLRVPEGREFLMQVPGLLSARLSDQRAANVVNYIIKTYAAESFPSDFVTYTATEAKQLRETKPADITSKRRALYDRLIQDGLPIQ